MIVTTVLNKYEKNAEAFVTWMNRNASRICEENYKSFTVSVRYNENECSTSNIESWKAAVFSFSRSGATVLIDGNELLSFH